MIDSAYAVEIGLVTEGSLQGQGAGAGGNASFSQLRLSLTAVEEQVRQVFGDPELDVCAVNLPESKKGEQILLLVAGPEIDLDGLRKRLLDAGSNPLTIPSEFRHVAEIPKLGSGKTDFTAARQVAEAAL